MSYVFPKERIENNEVKTIERRENSDMWTKIKMILK